MNTDKKRFTNRKNGHNKYWEVWVEGKNMFTHYGKIGTEGQTTIKELSSHYHAKMTATNKIDEKLSKGYIAVKPEKWEVRFESKWGGTYSKIFDKKPSRMDINGWLCERSVYDISGGLTYIEKVL